MVKYKVVILSLAFLAVLFASLSLTPWKSTGQAQPLSFVQNPGERLPESRIGDVGLEIFTTYVFPFEILALVLTAALVGAVYVARREAV